MGGIDTEQIRDKNANQEMLSRTREIKNDGRGGVTFYNGWLSWVLRWELQKVPKQLQHY